MSLVSLSILLSMSRPSFTENIEPEYMGVFASCIIFYYQMLYKGEIPECLSIVLHHYHMLTSFITSPTSCVIPPTSCACVDVIIMYI